MKDVSNENIEKSVISEKQMVVDDYQEKTIKNAVFSIDIEVLSNMKTLDDKNKEILLNIIYTTDNLYFYSESLKKIKFWTEFDRKILILGFLNNKHKKDIYELIYQLRHSFTKDEINLIVNELCDNKEFDILFNMINNLNYLLSSDNIIKIVEVLAMYDDAYELLNILNKLSNQLLPNQKSTLIKKICDTKISSVILNLLSNESMNYEDFLECIFTILDSDIPSIDKLLGIVELSKLQKEDLIHFIYKICETKDRNCIINTLKLIQTKIDKDIINEMIECLNDNKMIDTSVVSVISHVYFDLLTAKSIDIIINASIESKNQAYIEYISNKYKYKLTKNQIIDLIDGVISINNSLAIINVADNLNDKLDVETIEKIGYKICELKYPAHIYRYCELFYGKIQNYDLKEKLVKTLLELREIKYIILLAVFVENSLIQKLFKNSLELCMFVVSSKLFDSIDEKRIKEKLNISPKEPNVEKAIKFYELKPQKDKKKKQKDN